MTRQGDSTPLLPSLQEQRQNQATLPLPSLRGQRPKQSTLKIIRAKHNQLSLRFVVHKKREKGGRSASALFMQEAELSEDPP